MVWRVNRSDIRAINMESRDCNVTIYDDSTPQVRLDLLLHTQREIVRALLPAFLNTIDRVSNYMIDDEDDEDIRGHMRELATETVIDELISLLTRDPARASRQHIVTDVDGIAIDTLIACHSELAPASAQAWYAHRVGVAPEAYHQLIESLPDHVSIPTPKGGGF